MKVNCLIMQVGDIHIVPSPVVNLRRVLAILDTVNLENSRTEASSGYKHSHIFHSNSQISTVVQITRGANLD